MININDWQLSAPVNAISFDCDGTLSRIEGIDYLAAQNNVATSVQALTEQAMSSTGLSIDLYEQRLALVKPTHQQLTELAQAYYDNASQDLLRVIEVFNQLNKALFVISAGNNPAVSLFANKLNISTNRVFAVDLLFDKQGQYLDFNRNCKLTMDKGKIPYLTDIKQTFPRVLHIGDGLNDLQAKDSVTRFVGYGGNCFRQTIKNQVDYYIASQSLLGLLPLSLTKQEVERLDEKGKRAFKQGLSQL